MKILELSSLNETHILPATINDVDRKYIIKFNPSIAKLKGDIFVMTYRIFLAEKSKRVANFIPQANAQHGTPWGSRWESEYDGTGVALLRYDAETRNFYVIQDSILPTMDNMVECRLFRDSEGLLLSYYAFEAACRYVASEKAGEAPALGVTVCGSRSRACEFKYVTRLKFEVVDNHMTYNVLKPFIVCPSQNAYIKESSGIFRVKDSLFFQDDMMAWSFLEYKQKSQCTILHPEDSLYFYKLSEWYNQAIKFHPSTPLIPYTKAELLGVGYAQMDFWRIAELIEQQIFRNQTYFEDGQDEAQITAKSEPDRLKPIFMEEYIQSGAADFMRDIQTLFDLPDFKDVAAWSKYKEGHLHHRHFNFMFFYTVDPLTLQLKRFSYCFYPRPPSSTVSTYVIPCGIEWVEKNVVVVSYGSSHTTSNLMLMARDEIEKKLLYSPQDNPHLNQYPFMYTNH